MGKTRKVYISETIGGWNAAITTRGSHKIEKVNRTDARGPSIHVINRCIKGGLQRSVNGRYIGTGTQYMEKIIDPRSKIVTDNIEKPKRHTIHFILRYGSIIVGMDCTRRSGGTPQIHVCGHVIRQHTNSSMD